MLFAGEPHLEHFETAVEGLDAVKELVATGLLLGSRGVVKGIDYVRTLADMQDEAELNRTLEAQKKQFKGNELTGKTLGVVGLGAIGSLVAEMALTLGMDRQHHLGRLFAAHAEENLQHLHHKLHRRVIVIEQNNPVHGRKLDFRSGFLQGYAVVSL